MKSKYTPKLKELIVEILTNHDITNKELCRLINISEETFYKWVNPEHECYKNDFLELINDSKEIYREKTIRILEGNLYKLANGFITEDIKTEIKKDGETDTVVYKKIIKQKTERPPDTKAIEMLLKKHGVVYAKNDVVINGVVKIDLITEATSRKKDGESDE